MEGLVLKTIVLACCIASVSIPLSNAQCSSGVQADMVFILDASGSVGSGNFQTMLQFVQDLVDGFDIGTNTVRVGVQKYSSGTNTEFNLNTYSDKTSVKNRVASVVYTGGSTNTGGALQYMRTTMFTSGNGDRANVPNIGVILTDGRSNSYSYTASEAANARNAGITVFAIGIGSGIPLGELNEMATDPDSDHVFAVTSFSALAGISSAFQAQACPAVNGNWGNWGSYSSCTLTCGGGTMTRSRSCDNPAPSNGGASCSGSSTETASCNTHNCPIDGGFTTWTAWGTCSVTCNVGTHERTRSCTNPVPQYGGAACSGHTWEIQNCDVGPSVDGCSYSGASCVGCDPGYSFSGSDCDWCKTNFTGCSCENCQADHIGYNSDCGVLCYHGDPDVVGGRICVCHADTTLGHWAGSACSYCKVGWMSPLCTTCDTDYVGPLHCTVRCRWGQGYHVYKEDGHWGSRPLTPTFDCAVNNNDGTYTAYFGYANSNNHNLYISAGTNSYLTGSSGTLPTQYKPGTYNYVFATAPFTIGTAVSWTLGFPRSNTVFTVSVPANPNFCTSTPTSTLPTGAYEFVDPGHCQCMPGYYGSECQSVCPGGVGSPCYNHGTCDQVTGTCTCDPHWSQGTSCQSCDTGWSGNDCTVAVPSSSPRTTPSSTYVAKAFADGGFATFDGSLYTFNGVGEYKLWESRSGMSGRVAVYGRKTLTSSSGLATSLDAVSIVSGGNRLEIYAGQAEDSMEGTAYSNLVDGPIFVSTSPEQLASSVYFKRVTSDHYQVYMTSRYTINVYVRGRTLDVSIESDSYSCYDTYGMLSYCDGSYSNDMRASTGTTYSGSTLTTQNIHQYFGPSYLISSGSTNFNYGHYPYPTLSGSHLCFDRTHMESTAVATFSNGDVTLEIKMKPDVANTGCGVLFSYRTSDTITVLACSTYLQVYTPTTGTSTVPSISFTAGNWYHLAFVWSKNSENLRVLRYDSGNSGQAADVSLTALTSNPFQPGGTFVLGRYNSLSASAPEKLHWGFIGCLDDFRIWNYAVSDGVVSSRAWTFVTKDTASLSSVWRMDEGQGESTQDQMSDVTFTMQTADPWTKPQWTKGDYSAGSLAYSPYSLDYNLTGSYDRDTDLRSTLDSFCNSVVYGGALSGCSSLGAGQHEFFYLHCIYSGMSHRSTTGTMETVQAFADYCAAITTGGSGSSLTQSLCNTFSPRPFPAYSGISCTDYCQSGVLKDGVCTCEPGFWGTNCDQSCPATVYGHCNGQGICSTSTGQCACPDNFASGTNCVTCKSGFSGLDCSVSTLSTRNNGSYYLCAGYENGQMVTFDGLSYSVPQAGEFKMIDISGLDFYVRQVSCQGDRFCITGVWGYLGGDNVAIRAPMISSGEAMVEINGSPVTVDDSYSLATDVSIELYSEGLYLLHYRNRYDVYIRVYDFMLTIQALVSSSYCNTVTGLCGSCNNNPNDDIKDGGGNSISTSDVTTEQIVDSFLPVHEVSTGTTTHFIYNTGTYTEPRVTTGGGYAVSLDQTSLESQYLDVFTEDIVTLDFQVKPDTTTEGTVVGFTSDEIVSVSADGTYKLTINNTVYDSGVPVTAGEWNHVTMTYFKNNGSVIFYVDTETGDSQQGSFTISETVFNSPGVITLGGLSPRPGESLTSVPAPTFTGQVDNFRVWNRTFDPIIAKQNSYTNINSSTFDDLIVQWTFSEGQGSVSTDDVSGLTMNVPRQDTVQWQPSGPTMNVIDGMTTLQGGTDVILNEQLTQTISTSTLLSMVNETEYFCQDLIHNSQVHSSCSGSLGSNVATFFYDKCVSANIYVTDARYYSVQSLVDYAQHCRLLISPTPDPMESVCQDHPLMVSGAICTQSATCRFGTEDPNTLVCTCDTGYWGTTCAQACPGGAATPCNLHGTCNTDTGACLCSGQFTGTDCSACATGWSGANCDVMTPNPSDPWLTSSTRMCSFAVDGSVMAFGGKKFGFSTAGYYYFIRRDSGVAGSIGVQARLAVCLTGQVCLAGVAFYDDTEDLAVEVDTLTSALHVYLNGQLQAAGIGQVSSGSFTFQYLTTFSIQVSHTGGTEAVVGVIDSRLNLVVQADSALLGDADSLCGDGTVNVNDVTTPGSESLVSAADVIFNTTATTTSTNGGTTTVVVPNNSSLGTAGGSLYLNQTFLSSDPTSGLFQQNAPGTVDILIRPYSAQGVLFSYGYDSSFSVFLNDTLQIQVGDDVYDTGIQVTPGEWSQVAVAWNPALNLTTVYHVTDPTTMDYSRFTVTNMTCFQDGGVVTIGKWRQPNSPATHPPTTTSYLGEVDEAKLWSLPLSHSDVLSGFGAPVDTSDPTLVARWTFDEGQGATVNDFRGTHLYVTDHSQAGTTPEWKLSDAPVSYTPPTTAGPAAQTTTFLTDAQTVCSSAIGSFNTGNCPGLSADVSAFYLASCQDVVIQSGNLTKAAEVVASLVALCNVGSATPLTVGDYWCDPYAGSYIIGTGATCTATCQFPNTSLSTQTSCVCAEGYWGTGCDGMCPGGPSSPCNRHGVCDATSGTCTCQVNWQGSSGCDVCTAGWTGADCSVSFLSTTTKVICSAATTGRFTLFDGTSAQHTGVGGYTLYDEPSGPQVVVEQAPCGKMQACVYRASLTHGGDVIAFDYTQPSLGVRVVSNGVQVFPTSLTTMANGLVLSQPTAAHYVVNSSNDDFRFEVRVRDAYLSVDMLVDSTRCAANTGVCGPCSPQSASGCAATDVVCHITQRGVKDASTTLTVTTAETSAFIASQAVNVTASSLGYSGGGASSYTASTSEMETGAGYGLDLEGEGTSSDPLPASTVDVTKNITLEAVIHVDNAEGTVLSYADTETFSVNIDSGVFALQCGALVETTGISADTGNWSHVGLVYDPVNGRTVFHYIDSNLIPRYSIVTMPTACIPDQGTLSVGQWQLSKSNQGSVPPGTFRGQVDRVTLWNTRFGPADFLNHWRQDFDPTGEPDLLAYWRFNEGQGDVAYDAVQGVVMTLPSPSVWTVSQAPIDTPVTQQHNTGATSVLSTHEQLAVSTCQSLIYSGDINTHCGLLTVRANYYYLACVSDVTSARDGDYAMDSVLQFATECQTTLGLTSWPAQGLCNQFPSRTFPTWFGPSCSLRCDFGTRLSGQNLCECDDGYWGTNCDQACPGSSSGQECNGHGTCQQDTGTCACHLKFQGDASCGSCTSGWTGGDCNILAPASSSRPPTMCTADRGGFVLTYDLFGVTLDQLATYTLLSLNNFQVQVTQVSCHSGLCIHGVGVNYHDRSLVLSLGSDGGLDIHVDAAGQERGVAQSLDPTSVASCPLTVAWTSDYALEVALSPLSFRLLVNAVGGSLTVVVKEIDSEACCGTRMQGLCGSCGTCSSSLVDTCQLTSTSPAPAPSVPSATSCNVAFTGSETQTSIMQGVACAQVGSSNNLVSSLLNQTSLGLTSSFYGSQQGSGEGICFDTSSALVKDFQLLTTNYVTLEFLVKACNTSDCYGTLISYTKDKTFSIRHSSEVAITYGGSIWYTNFALEDSEWNQLSVVFDKTTYDFDLYYFDRTGLAGRHYVQLSDDVFPNDGYLGVGRWQPSTDPSDVQMGVETFKGCIDQLRFWNTTFDSIQVQNHWNVTHDGTEDHLIALWKFDNNRNGFTYDKVHDVQLALPTVPFPPGEIDFSDAPIPYRVLQRAFPFPVTFSFTGRRKRSLTSTLPLTDIVNACHYIFGTSTLATSCSGVGSQMTEKYFFDCLSDMYYGEDLTDALASTLAYADYCTVTLGLAAWPARTLCNYFPISAGFPNWIGDNCDVECVNGFRHPDDNNTCVCDPGYWGANCSGLCPGGTENPCSGYGTCDVTSGQCPCPVSRRGAADCSACQTGWTGPGCVITTGTTSVSTPIAKVSDLGHVMNLDGVGFGVEGVGEFHLLQLSPGLLIQGKFVMCRQNYTCLAHVGMRVGSSGDGYAFLTVQAPYVTNGEPTVYLNGALNPVRKVAYFTNFEMRRASLHEVILDIYGSVQVTIRSRKRLLEMTVTVPTSHVPATVGLLAGSGSTSATTRYNYLADHSRINPYLNLCSSHWSNQGERGSSYSSGTLSLPTGSTLSSPSTGYLSTTAYCGQLTVATCDSIVHYASTAFSSQEGDGYALVFDDTAVFSQFDTATLMSGNLSLELLVKVDSSGQGGVLLSLATTDLFLLYVTPSYYIQILYSGVWYSPGLQLQTDLWNKILLVYESAVGDTKLYVFDHSYAVTRADLTLPTAIFDTPGRLTLGKALLPEDGQYYSPVTPFTGEMDNFRLWSILVEPTMVLDIADLGMSMTDYTIRAAWTFDEAEGDEAFDLIQGAILQLPVRPWAQPGWTASDKTNTRQVVTSPLGHYFVNKSLEVDAESTCSSLMSAVSALPACSSLSAGVQSFYLMQCLQQVASASTVDAAYLAMYDLGDVCYRQLAAGSWPLTAHCLDSYRRGTDCVTSCVFGEWDGTTCTCFDGFSDTDCSNACPAANGVFCNGHGTCTSGGVCDCDHNWQGSACSACNTGWTGSECTIYYGTQLTSQPRTGFLSATGEVITFDGASFTFSGVTGVYRVLQDTSDGMYVQAHTVFCEYGTCVDAVGVRMSNLKVTVYPPPRAYALPRVKIDGTEIVLTESIYTINSNFKIYVMARNSLKVAISSPYQCDVTVTSAGRFLQAGVYVRSYMCSSSSGLMGECDGSNSNDLYYTPTSYSQATLVSQLSSLYEVSFSSSIFSHDTAEFNGVTKNTVAGFAVDYTNTALQSQQLAFSFSTNQSYTLSFSYRPRNVVGSILTYSRNESFVIQNSNPIVIEIGGVSHTTSASSNLNDWNQIILTVDRANNEVEFFHYYSSQTAYEKLPLGVHEFLEPDGWLTLGQLQVSIDETPFTLWDGSNMFEGDISDVILFNGVLPHVILQQAIQLKTGLLDFAASDVIYNFRLKEGTSYQVQDVAGNTDLQFAYAPWQDTPWELSDQTVSQLPARAEDQWDMAVDYDRRTREVTATALCTTGFFQHADILSACGGVDANFRGQLEGQCLDSYLTTGQPEAVLHSMMAFADFCGYIASPNVQSTTLCDAQFQSLPWAELRCSAGCKHGYKIADGTCQCYPGYYDTDCGGTCPGGVDTPCNLHGTCNKDGTCTCDVNWTGSSCASCDTDWTGTDCNVLAGSYISTGYDTAVAQVRSQGWVTTFDGHTFLLGADDTYLLLRVHDSNLYVYARQTTCGDDPKTFTCFDDFVLRHGSHYYFADWTRQDEHELTLRTQSADVTVLTKRTFGTLTISRSSLTSLQFVESVSGLLVDVTLYDHGPHITLQLHRKTDLVALTLSGLLASCDTQFAARATSCTGVTMCHSSVATSSISHCQTTVSSTSFASLATNAISTEKTTFNSLAGSTPSHQVTEYQLFMNRTGLITANVLSLPNSIITFEVIYYPEAHGGVVFSYGDVSTHIALVDNDTSINVVYGNKVVSLGQSSRLTEWNQVSLVWDPAVQHLELYHVDELDNVYTVRARLDSNAFLTGGRATLGQLLPGATLSTNDHLNVFTGFMGELRVYTRPHNPTVVTQNTFIDVTENTPDLLHAWNFDVNEGDYFADLKYSVSMVATNVTETPLWSAAPYTLTVKDGATSFWVTLPRTDPFETLAAQKCQDWFSNTTLLANCQLGAPFIATYVEQCYDDQVARRNHSEGVKSVLQFAEFCRRLEFHGGAGAAAIDTLLHAAGVMCQDFPEASFQGYWGADCGTRCLFGRMEGGECHCTDPYWGTECDQACPVSDTDNTAVCDGHGRCRKTDGVCVCQSRWTGVSYDYANYTTGYIDSVQDYACTVCSSGWYGIDCSTAVLERPVNGSDGYALIASSVVITVDGASVELSRTGAYRLLTSTNVTVDGYFKQCQGRYDCRALQELSFAMNDDLLSLSVNDRGNLAVHKYWHEKWRYRESSAPTASNTGDIIVLCESARLCRVTMDYTLEVVVEVFNSEMFAGFIVSQNISNIGVGGLLGNFDGHWLNEFYTGHISDSTYITEFLSADTKQQEAETYHLLAHPNHVLNHTDLTSHVDVTGGHALFGNSSQEMTLTYAELNLTTTDEFTIEMWVYIEAAAGETYDLVTFSTEAGDGTLSIDGGNLKLSWQKNHTSYVTVADQTWSRLALTWRSSDGLVYLYRLESGGAAMMELEWGFPSGLNLTFYSLTFGGRASNALTMDYVRVWSVVRDLDHLHADLAHYDTAMHHGVEFLALFDEGFGETAHAKMVLNDTVLVAQGLLTNLQWTASDVPTTQVTVPAELPAIVNDTAAVEACQAEFDKRFTTFCPDFGAIKQLLMELCISDVTRFNDTKLARMAGTSFAFYCQAVTQQSECKYDGYLDFCPPTSDPSSLPLILGLVFGALACCSCCIAAAALRKKLFGGEEAASQKPDLKGQDGPQSKIKPDGFEEKEFTGADLPPEAKPPVPPPSTNMYNYLSKMDGIEADDQELFTKFNRSPSVNSIAVSLQSYGIGGGPSSPTSPTFPTSPSRASLGGISEEVLTPVHSPRE